MLRLSCRRLNSVLVEGELLRHLVLNVFGAHSIWESMSESLSSSPNSVPVLEVPTVFGSFEVLDMVFGAISSIGVADRKGPKFTILSEMISSLGPLRINLRGMGSFCGGRLSKTPLKFLCSQDITLLHYAVALEWEELVLILLRCGASPNMESHVADGYGMCTLSWTPLCCAAFLGNARIVLLMLLNGGFSGQRPMIWLITPRI